MKLYVGIDNGLDGAIVAVQDNGEIYKAVIMPTIKLGKGISVDVCAVDMFMGDMFRAGHQVVAVIETASKHSPGVMALCSTWYTYGQLISMLKLRSIKFEEVHPKKWQKEFWVSKKMPDGKKFDTKAAALQAAMKIWPNFNWTRSDKSVKAHDGLVDAALIAEYARRKNL